MKITVSQLQKLNSPFLKFSCGDANAEAYRPWPPEIAPPGALIYVSNQTQLETAIEAPAGIIVALESLVPEPRKLAPHQALFTTKAINAAMALINPNFDQKAKRWAPGISPKAEIHPGAQLGADVSVGAFTVIGDGVKIGAGAQIGPHCVIEKEAQIGEGSILHPFVMIGGECELGARCEIHSHTTIGADGFGYVTAPDKKHFKVPQLGRVVLGHDVEIGANCTIDRATLHETTIGSGTKMDNLCHIAHNCKIGANSMIAAGFAMAGSCSVGEGFVCGGKVVFSDHCHATDNVTIGGNSAVTKDVTEPGMYVGYPLQPFRDGLRTISSLPSIPEMRKQISQIQQKLEANKA